MDSIKEYLEKNKDRFLDELVDLLKIPSISADPAYKGDMLKAAEAVKARLLEAGCDTAEVSSNARTSCSLR